MESVILNFSIDGFGVSGQFEVDTGISKKEWDNLTFLERDEIATEHYNDHVAWGWEES